ncbi:unnamed protein product [Ectocarpus sp. 8 AP-2014]
MRAPDWVSCQRQVVCLTFIQHADIAYVQVFFLLVCGRVRVSSVVCVQGGRLIPCERPRQPNNPRKQESIGQITQEHLCVWCISVRHCSTQPVLAHRKEDGENKKSWWWHSFPPA